MAEYKRRSSLRYVQLTNKNGPAVMIAPASTRRCRLRVFPSF